MLKSSLRDNPWVQSPLSKEVEILLYALDPNYYQRGAGQATKDLNETIEKHREWVSPIIDLKEFPFAYVTSGATEAINHWRLSDTRSWQYFKGDYQYPQMLSGNGIEVDELRPNDVLYVSNPKCHDGNFAEFGNINNPVILDCAYISATAIKRINVPVNTEQVMFSFSKGFGLIGQRCGLVYTKKPHPTLHPLKKVECYNYSAAPIMSMIMDKFNVNTMYNIYLNDQTRVCEQYDLTPSDTYFIGTSTDVYYKKQRRVDGIARLCLTEVF